LCRIGRLRNLLRVDEGTDLDLPQSCGDELLGQGDLGLGGHDRLLDLETVAQSGVEDVDGVGPDHGTPSHMFPNNGTLLASSRLCEGHFRYTARSSRMTGYVRHVRALGELTAVSPVYREARFFGRYVWIAWPASSSLRSTSSRSTTSLSPAKREGPWPAMQGWMTNSNSSMRPSSASASGSVTPPTASPVTDCSLSSRTAVPRSSRMSSEFQSTRSKMLETTYLRAGSMAATNGSRSASGVVSPSGRRQASSIIW